MQDFFSEYGVVPEVSPAGRATLYSSGRVRIYCGDIHAIDWRSVAPFDSVYDRAALIALPRPERARYAKLIHSVMRPAAQGLIITLEYDQRDMDGPPFSVGAQELSSLYDGARLVQLARDDNALANNRKFAERGVATLAECVYRIEWPTTEE